jgi:hemerythrin
MKDIIRMNQLAGIVTEGQAKKLLEVLNEEMPSSFPSEEAWNLWLKLSEEMGYEDYDLQTHNHLQIGSLLRELQWVENNKDKFEGEELMDKFSDYLDQA